MKRYSSSHIGDTDQNLRTDIKDKTRRRTSETSRFVTHSRNKDLCQNETKGSLKRKSRKSSCSQEKDEKPKQGKKRKKSARSVNTSQLHLLRAISRRTTLQTQFESPKNSSIVYNRRSTLVRPDEKALLRRGVTKTVRHQEIQHFHNDTINIKFQNTNLSSTGKSSFYESGLVTCSESEEDTINKRIRKNLSKSEHKENKNRLQEQLLNDSSSIDGDITGFKVEDGPIVRKYLDRYTEHCKRNEWRQYNSSQAKEFGSLKSVLNKRSQFNDSKREFLSQLQKHFIGNEQSVTIQSKDPQINDRAKRIYGNTGERNKKNETSRFNLCRRFNKDYDEKMLLIKDERSFRVHGKLHKFGKNSLGILSNKNKFRIILVWIVTWRVFDNLILFLIMMNSLGLGLKDYLDPKSETEWNQWIDSFDPYFTVAFCIECALKILAYGFYNGKRTYLKDPWNWLDFIVVICSLLEQYVPNASGLRTFRLFRPLRSLNNVKSMQILVETLFLSLLSLGGILGLAVFFFTIFSILGITQWRGLSHYRCRQTEFPVDGDWLPVEGDTQLCYPGQRECPVGWCGSLFERHDSHGDLDAVDDLYRDSEILDLNYGVTNFDNLGFAFITIFQCITMEGWTSVMYIYQDVANQIFVTLYFMSCVIICSFFLLNLTIAVMLMQYDELEQRNANSIHKTALRILGREGRLPVLLVEFIIKQSNLQIGKAAKKTLNDLQTKEKTFCQKLLATEYIQGSIEQNSYYRNKIPRFFYAVAKSNLFGILVMVCIILNTLVLSMDRFPLATKQEMQILSVFNMFFNIVFTAEVIIKMIGLGLVRYIKNIENIFDFVVVMMSLIELVIGGEKSSFGALRAIRLFRVFKLFKSGDLRILMDSIVFTISTIGPYTVLLMLFLYVFALMGMSFFAGKFRFKDHGVGAFDLEEGEAPRANFDNLKDALLTTFVCFIGDNWTFVMYDSIRSSGTIFAIYYVLVISFGNIVMLNLFLAILLGNFDKARDFAAKKKLLLCFNELRQAGHDLSECIDMILDDTAEYCKVSILKWDRRGVNHESQRPSKFLRSMLALNACFMERFTIELKRDYKGWEQDDSFQTDEEMSEKPKSRSRKRKSSARYTQNKYRLPFSQTSYPDSQLQSQQSSYRKIQLAVPPLLEKQKSLEMEKIIKPTPTEKDRSATPQAKIDFKLDEHGFAPDKSIQNNDNQDGQNLLPFVEPLKSDNDAKSYLSYTNDKKIVLTQPILQDDSDGQEIVVEKSQRNATEEKSRSNQQDSKKGDQLINQNELPLHLQDRSQDISFCDLNNAPGINDSNDSMFAQNQNLLPVVSKPISKSESRIFKAFKSIFSRQSSQKKEQYIDLLQVQKRVLKPSGYTIKRSKETTNLQELIQKSKEYDVEREDYHLHDDLKNDSASGAEQNNFMVLGKSEDHRRHSVQPLQRLIVGNLGENNTSSSALIEITQQPSRSIAQQDEIQENQMNNQNVDSKRGFKDNLSSPSRVNMHKLGLLKAETMHSRRSKRSMSPGKLGMVQRRKLIASGKDSNIYENGRLDKTECFEEFEQNQRRQKCCTVLCWRKVRTFLSESSLFIFHKDFKIRKLCIKCLEPQPLKSSDDSQVSDFVEVAKVSTFEDKRSGNPPSNQSVKMNENKISTSIRGTSTRLRRSKARRQKSSSQQIQSSVRRIGRCRRCLSCFNIPPDKMFDRFILLLIFTSSVMLALDNPLNDPNSLESKVYKVIDIVHTVLFTFEMLIKIIGLGFFTNKFKNRQLQPYIRSTWNCLDFFVVMSSLAEIFLPILTGGSGGANSFKSLKSLRALRALRPLRMVSKNEGMKLVVGALMTSIPSMTNVLVVCLLLLLILAIVGVNLFKGKFFHCVNLTYDETLAIVTKADCLQSGGDWVNNEINFDNVINAMLTLFQMMTTEGWQSVMYNGIDAVGIDQQPKKDYQPIMTLYFVAFMIIGSQFIINLFVGVVIDNFNKIREQDEMGSCFVTQEQRSWIEIQKICLSKNLIQELRRPSGYQKTFTKLTEHSAFEYFITGCIIANTIAMALVSYRESPGMTKALEILNYFFAVIFNVEMILKLLAQGRHYFRQGWNIFDCFIVFGTNFGLVMKFAGAGAQMGATTSVIRGFRIMRIFRLVKASISMRLIIDTLMNILPQITNIMSLMVILLFIYAALGINLFSQVIYQEQLNEKNNFRTFGSAMVLLMRCATGEDWNLVMYEVANDSGYDGVKCRMQEFEERQTDGILGCGSSISYVYFLSFMVIITMLIMNLAVAAVIQGLNTACAENLGIVSADDVNHFIELWKYFDPQATGWIEADQLVYLLYELKAPLGRKKLETVNEAEDFQNTEIADRYLVHKEKQIVLKKKQAIAILRDNLHIRMRHSVNGKSGYKVHYMDVLKGLLKRILNEQKKEYKLKGKVGQKISNMWQKKHKDLKLHNKIRYKGQQGQDQDVKYTAAEQAAARIIQNWLKNKRNVLSSKPEVTKKTMPAELDKFRQAQQKLAKLRVNTDQRPKNELLPEILSNRSRKGRMTNKDYADEEMVQGGNHILRIIGKPRQTEEAFQFQIQQLNKQWINNQQRRNYHDRKKTASIKIYNPNQKMTWIYEHSARRLAKRVENEDIEHQKLFFHPNPSQERAKMESVLVSSFSGEEGTSSRAEPDSKRSFLSVKDNPSQKTQEDNIAREDSHRKIPIKKRKDSGKMEDKDDSSARDDI